MFPVFQPRVAQKADEIEDEDFFSQQQRLQAEATMALAQVNYFSFIKTA